VIERLIALLESKETHTVAELATALETMPEMVEAMIDWLTRSGRVHAAPGACDDQCAGCGLRAVCSGSTTGRLWMVEPAPEQ